MMFFTTHNVLDGRTVVVTRDEGATGALSRELLERGAEVVHWPAVRIEPPADPAHFEAVVRKLDTYDWVAFTSARAAHAVLKVWSGRAPKRARIGVVGEGTARLLREAGWPVHVEPEGASARLLARALVAKGVSGARVFFPASSLAGPGFALELGAAGASVEEVIAYRTASLPLGGVARQWSHELLAGRVPSIRVDALSFASPSAVAAWRDALGVEGMGEMGRRVVVGAIGTTTGTALREAGCVDAVVARESTFAGLADRLGEALVPVENA